MKDNTGKVTAETLHRGAKILMDTQEAATHAEAMAMLRRFQIGCVVGPEIVTSPTLQAALLTIVNAGSRCCLGGIYVSGVDRSVPLLVSGGAAHDASCLVDAITGWGGQWEGVDGLRADAPRIVLGTPALRQRNLVPSSARQLRLFSDGWLAGVEPVSSGMTAPVGRELSLSGILSGALAVSECFQFLRGSAVAMRRRIARSLWGSDGSATTAGACGPDAMQLPESMWILGLGHLGQAYLWALLMLPYDDPTQVRLLLNDDDRISEANLSTSLLSRLSDIGRMKTRCVAEVVERHGFQTRIQERRFDDQFVRVDEDPTLLLCGVDSAPVRRTLAHAEFPEIIEAGLGHIAEEYLSYQLHTFPGARTPEQIWPIENSYQATKERHSNPAYQDLLNHGADRMDACGIVEIAGKAVGVPFVGAYVGAIVIAEAIKAVMGRERTEVEDGSLRSPERARSACRESMVKPANLGFLRSSH